MKILLAAAGSSYTQKALAFLVANETLCGPKAELAPPTCCARGSPGPHARA